ncbi:MAG: hypothetical protein JW807_08400 [Spirochaetes bacterium]|nr:hypothetical protein [Spirochaetota bacterium]
MKNTIVLLVSALMMLSLVSCKKKVEGKKADATASGFYCCKEKKCDCTIKGDALTVRCTKTKPHTFMWNEKVKGYTASTAEWVIKLLYVNNNFLVYLCNGSFSECEETEVYTRCK